MSTAETITTAALSLFHRQGYHASGVEQLSQVAGVTKKTLYRHFPSKEHLVEAAMQLRDVQFMNQMKTAVEAVAAPRRPQAYLDFIAAWARQPDFCGCAFINASAEYSAPNDPPHLLAKAHKQNVLDYLQTLCSEAGLKQPSATALQLFLIGEGLIVACQVNGTSDALVEAATSLLTALTQAST
ncbi:TetR/AcrR family transcriptional regulator [Pseudomonas sp. PDM14]|uniref:TetR/AcrR family transcriptional regulator n=1 Tax=Pseudomonas sp. PDM14 TaxID=2769288 RepID=UPI00177DDFA3|nr:TetR/AcrR family transcriptional regulator [Pseudomonas sp. PDM14]MBD9482052.1 TetR/AcrR family transcriptional regulator [Pseudomonas sp. PDM14]